MNVYLMGFDSVSRMTLMRKMKNFYQYVTEDLGGIVLKGYNIVGDGKMVKWGTFEFTISVIRYPLYDL